jgi:hypothetical protein
VTDRRMRAQQASSTHQCEIWRKYERLSTVEAPTRLRAPQ